MPAPTRSPKQIDPDAWYSAAQAAEILSTHLRTIQRARLRGHLRGTPINGRGDLRFKGVWLLDWLETQTADRLLQDSPSSDVA
jgi:Helix-turn-helix domain